MMIQGENIFPHTKSSSVYNVRHFFDNIDRERIKKRAEWII